MQRTEVKFVIEKGGKINMEVLNGVGQSCIEATRDLEVSLSRAGEKTDSGKKPEFYDSGANLSVFNDLNS